MPRIYYYNPTCEMAIANDHHSYQPPDRLKQFEKDLGEILMFLANRDDIVINQYDTEKDFEAFWKTINKEMPVFMSFDQLRSYADKNNFTPTPWGSSKAVRHLVQSLDVSLDLAPASLRDWTPELRRFFSRETSVTFEQQWLAAEIPQFCQLQDSPRLIRAVSELTSSITDATLPLVIKSLWSSSGRGICMVRDPLHVKPALTWASGRIRHDGAVVLEKWQNKVADFSFQFHIAADNTITYLGINYFSTNEEGNFDKEWIHQPDIFRQITADNQLPFNWEEQCVAQLMERIKTMQWHIKYEGIIGMDAMIIKTDSGLLQVRCCVEINLRYNMGLINMALKPYFAEAAQGFWKIEQFDPGGWFEFYHEQMKKHPATIENDRLKSGFFPLVSPHKERIYAAWGIVE